MAGLGHVQAGVIKRIGELQPVTLSSFTPSSSSLDPCIEPPVHLLAQEQQKHKVLNTLLSELAPIIVNQQPAARRPFLEAFSNHKKPGIENMLDTKYLTPNGICSARKHAIWPGAFITL